LPGSATTLRLSSLIKGAVEELLRYDAPVEMITTLYTREEVELHGIRIPKGEQVMVVLGAANRDPRRTADSDKLDIASLSAGRPPVAIASTRRKPCGGCQCLPARDR